MKVEFRNIGMLESANIRFDGLTVIAGENDTGKSTVGRLMFSIIKTFNQYDKNEDLTNKQQILLLIKDRLKKLKNEIENTAVHEMLGEFFKELENKIFELLAPDAPKEQIQTEIFEKITGFASTIQQTFGIEINLEDILENINNFTKSIREKEAVFDNFYRKYTASVFGVLDSYIGGRFFDGKRYSVNGQKDDKKIFEIVEMDNKTPGDIEIKLFQTLFFQDATFIESPILLNQADAVLFAKTLLDVEGDIKKKVELLDRVYVPESLRDFIRKLTDLPSGRKHPEILTTIREIISGNFYYDKKKKDFVFEKGGKAFGGLWTASGIKVFGVLGILLQNGFLNDKSLLVIDEPETHMHPLWEIRLAEILVELTKTGITILLTSHSPYLVEALKLYSDKKLPPGKAAFYLSKKNDDQLTSRIIEVTRDISPIFKLMAEPFRKLESFQLEDIL